MSVQDFFYSQTLLFQSRMGMKKSSKYRGFNIANSSWLKKYIQEDSAWLRNNGDFELTRVRVWTIPLSLIQITDNSNYFIIIIHW